MKKLLLLILSFAFFSSFTYSQSGWFSQSITVNYPFLAVYFVDSQTGWTTCTYNFIGAGTIYKTTNGGSNWVNFGSAGNDIYSMSFINSSTGYMTGHYGGILYVAKTTNGGTNFINSNNYDEYGKAWSIYLLMH
ncbi:MAG TPA: hypothetical protein VIL99_15985 [Ignavibacteria bacterium]